MDDIDELEFKLNAYTPSTIPMEQLAKYLTALSKLLGSPSHVHFKNLSLGSTCIAHMVDEVARPKVEARLNAINQGLASNDAKIAFNELDQLCKTDHATAQLYRIKNGERIAETILNFGNLEPQKPLLAVPFYDAIVIDGELTRIGGKDKTAHAQIIDDQGVAWNGELDKALALRLAPHLYANNLRLHGTAKWQRQDNGVWKILHLKITDFELLEDQDLWEAVQDIRAMTGLDWQPINDINAHFINERGYDEERS
jgi:hypothetical protein